MPGHDANFATGIADIYARLLVPMLFEPFARDLAARVDASAHDVLETAAGTGALTRKLAARLPDARIIATDLNAPMLEVADHEPGTANVRWRVADAQSLPFDDDAFDAVLCQFGVMFFPDRVLGYTEARRVLRDGGVFLFNAWDAIEANPITATITDALAQRFPDDPPTFMARVPHGYHDAARIEADVRRAGFVDIHIRAVDATAIASSAEDAATAFCAGTPLRHEIEARDPGGVDDAIVHVTSALRKRFGDGHIEAPMRALVVEARG
ncbi:class I SAM-dependent methyltransferase [Lysobacter sp. HA18]